MVEVKRGRGRPRKDIVGVFKLEEKKRSVGRPKKNKIGRPKGAKNKKPTLEHRVERLESITYIIGEVVAILAAAHNEKVKK